MPVAGCDWWYFGIVSNPPVPSCWQSQLLPPLEWSYQQGEAQQFGGQCLAGQKEDLYRHKVCLEILKDSCRHNGRGTLQPHPTSRQLQLLESDWKEQAASRQKWLVPASAVIAVAVSVRMCLGVSFCWWTLSTVEESVDKMLQRVWGYLVSDGWMDEKTMRGSVCSCEDGIKCGTDVVFWMAEGVGSLAW